VLSSLIGRLVVEWSKDAVNWAKTAATVGAFPVVEIADPETVPFPGFDRVLVTHTELQAVIEDARLSAWRTALGAVQGIDLIADTSTGRLYVGRPTVESGSSAGGASTPATVTAATSRCASSPASTPLTRGTSRSPCCACSDRASLPPKSTRPRPTTNAPCSPASTASTGTNCCPPAALSQPEGATDMTLEEQIAKVGFGSQVAAALLDLVAGPPASRPMTRTATSPFDPPVVTSRSTSTGSSLTSQSTPSRHKPSRPSTQGFRSIPRQLRRTTSGCRRTSWGRSPLTSSLRQRWTDASGATSGRGIGQPAALLTSPARRARPATWSLRRTAHAAATEASG
jgi:hypothetical protein